MRARVLCCSVLAFLQIMTWVSAASRPLPPDADAARPPDSGPKQYCSEEVKHQEKEEAKKIGSTPPNCESKCYGCNPCVAIQVPATNARFSLQYANYLPEGWKCKCGPSFYTP